MIFIKEKTQLMFALVCQVVDLLPCITVTGSKLQMKCKQQSQAQNFEINHQMA